MESLYRIGVYSYLSCGIRSIALFALPAPTNAYSADINSLHYVILSPPLMPVGTLGTTISALIWLKLLVLINILIVMLHSLLIHQFS